MSERDFFTAPSGEAFAALERRVARLEADTNSQETGSKLVDGLKPGGLLESLARIAAKYARQDPRQIMAEDEEEAKAMANAVADWLGSMCLYDAATALRSTIKEEG
ncbi:MAG: hypothetical protein ACYTBJ_22505 [Planctomycetota bacterium]|jgi:hypothetical protein